MKFKGRLTNIVRTLDGKVQVTFTTPELTTTLGINEYINKDLTVEFSKSKRNRSLNANAMLWACLSELAAVLRTNKDDLYLKMLREYGQFTYVCIKKTAYEKFARQWRICEVIDEVEVNGQPAVQVLVYWGSSTYTVDEFKRLLEGVVNEMQELDIPIPTSEERSQAYEQWAKDFQS